MTTFFVILTVHFFTMNYNTVLRLYQYAEQLCLGRRKEMSFDVSSTVLHVAVYILLT